MRSLHEVIAVIIIIIVKSAIVQIFFGIPYVIKALAGTTTAQVDVFLLASCCTLQPHRIRFAFINIPKEDRYRLQSMCRSSGERGRTASRKRWGRQISLSYETRAGGRRGVEMRGAMKEESR